MACVPDGYDLLRVGNCPVLDLSASGLSGGICCGALALLRSAISYPLPKAPRNMTAWRALPSHALLMRAQPGPPGGFTMCDYSLEHLASRPAKVGDQLVTTKFGRMYTTGLCAVGEPSVAVCIRPGTELAFEQTRERLNVNCPGPSDG